MTRINCVPPSEISNWKQLFADYRELPRVRKFTPRHIGGEYRLGTGHVLFFLDKGAYLEKRHADVLAELKRRKPSFKTRIPLLKLDWSAEYMQDWTPTAEAQALNRRRITERLGAMRGKHENPGTN